MIEFFLGRVTCYGWIPEWPKGTDCKSAANCFGGSNPPPSIRWCGGIGRRKGLKIPRWQHRAGSSPATSSKKASSTNYQYLKLFFILISITQNFFIGAIAHAPLRKVVMAFFLL